MDTLDNLVVDHLSRRLFTTERLTEILAAAFARRAQQASEVDHRVASLQREVIDASDKLKRLYRMVEDGVAEVDDILRDRLESLKLDREQAALDGVRAYALPATEIPPEMIEKFGREMRENIANGDVPFRKAYLRSIIDQVEVGDHTIRIIGDTATLEQVVAGKSVSATGVRSFVRKWRAIQNKTTNSYVIEITL